MSSAPLFFTHYGNSAYLKYVLLCAKKTNPKKRLIFLGDDSNRKIVLDNGWEHFNYSTYLYGEKKIDTFNKFFIPVSGRVATTIRNGSDFWIKFTILRWFIMRNFAQQNNIRKFWTFDTDTMILKDLEQFEEKYQKYDFTEQCLGSCVNGFVNNIEALDLYLDYINGLFQNLEKISKIKNDIIDTDQILGEMNIYAIFKNTSDYDKLKTVQISTIDEQTNSMFDDCLIYSDLIYNKDREYKSTYYIGKYKNIINVFSKNGNFYFKKNNEKISILNTINASCLCINFLEKILKLIINQTQEEQFLKHSLKFKMNSILSYLVNKSSHTKKVFLFFAKKIKYK